MKLQSDNHFIQSKKGKRSTKSPVDLQRQQLDFLLTTLYQPIKHKWLKKQPDQKATLLDPAKTDSLLINSPGSIKTMKTAWIKGLAPVSGLIEKSEGAKLSCAASALYLRLWETSIEDTSVALRQAHQMLAQAGTLVMELISFSDFKAYPYHYSFTRAVDLIGELETNQSLPNHLTELLEQIGFKRMEKVYSRPAFLPKAYNRIISVCLGAFRQEILQQTGTSQEEIDALLPALIQFEEQEDTLISRPGLYLLHAIKN